MESQRFDQITRGMATRGNRRNLLRGLTGLTASSLALFGLGHQARFARALQDATSTEEQSVILFEEMGQIAHDHVGSCEEFLGNLGQFYTQQADLIAQIKTEQEAWDHDRREQHVASYGTRREVAANRILAAYSRCSFSVSEDTPPATPAGTMPTPAIHAWQPIATPVTSPGTEQPAPQLACNGTIPMFCVNTATKKSTPKFEGPATCDSDEKTSCDPCFTEPVYWSAYCTEHFPDFCPSGQCDISFSKTDLCCLDICPVSTKDCLEWAAAEYASENPYTGPNQCFLCKVGWCTVTDSCHDNCEGNGCCSSYC